MGLKIMTLIELESWFKILENYKVFEVKIE